LVFHSFPLNYGGDSSVLLKPKFFKIVVPVATDGDSAGDLFRESGQFD